MLGKVLRGLSNGLVYGGALVSGFLILLTAFMVGYEVMMRYVFDAPTTWTFELTVFMIMYAAYLGSAFTMKAGKHVRVDFFTDWFAKFRLPSLALRILCNLVVLAFWLIATWTTLDETIAAYQIGDVTMSYERWPLAIPLAAIVIGGILILVQLIHEIVGQVAERRNG